MSTIYKAKIKEYEADYLKDLAALVACESVRDIKNAQPGAPFGPGIRDAFDEFLSIADRLGFAVRDVDGYACEVSMGESRDYIGIVGHLDVVEAGDRNLWKTEPFALTRTADGMLYGRGVNDDKGPLLACLYAARIGKDLGHSFPKCIKIIAGGAEETTWECMSYYFARNPQPSMGFSPDGNFPIVNGEKGILKCELFFAGTGGRLDIRCGTLENYVCDRAEVYRQEGEHLQTFTGRRALSRNPQRGENALFRLAEWMRGQAGLSDPAARFADFMNECLTNDFYGHKSGLYAADERMGETSVCPTGLLWQEDGLHLYLDIRYPRSTSKEVLCARLEKLGGSYGFDMKVMSEKKLLYVEEDSRLICGLKRAYRQVMGEPAQVLTKGGASYARVLECGVAFGASFDGEDSRPHMPNECMPLSSLQKAMEIYCAAIAELECV